jgi:hypothetical protein
VDNEKKGDTGGEGKQKQPTFFFFFFLVVWGENYHRADNDHPQSLFSLLGAFFLALVCGEKLKKKASN